MTPDEMRKRTKAFALRIIRLVDSLPKRRSAARVGDQLLRAGTSVAANYRAASRARSAADFVAKLGIVEEEADESLFWMEVLVESAIMQERLLKPLLQEASEILAIVVASINTARGGRRGGKPQSAARGPQSIQNAQAAIRSPRGATAGKSAIRNPQSAMAPESPTY